MFNDPSLMLTTCSGGMNLVLCGSSGVAVHITPAGAGALAVTGQDNSSLLLVDISAVQVKSK